MGIRSDHLIGFDSRFEFVGLWDFFPYFPLAYISVFALLYIFQIQPNSKLFVGSKQKNLRDHII